MQSKNDFIHQRIIQLFLVGIFFIFSESTKAQTPNSIKTPTPTEVMFGNKRIFIQTVLKKKFSPQSKFGFLNISSIASGYDNNLRDLDIAIPVLITYKLYKGISLLGGVSINNRVGNSPLIGFQHSLVNKEWIVLTNASIFLNSTKNLELFGIYEFKPSINSRWQLYNRVQLLYIHNTRDVSHARSFLQLRTGVKRKELNFGLGANLDQYGPEKNFKSNYGVFIGWTFE